jgi:tetratricopeptide (TPR) repeat protein
MSNYHYLGIGIDKYDNFKPLPKSVKDVVQIGRLLNEKYGYKCKTIENPTELRARWMLKRRLKEASMPLDSTLVLLWSGHGDKQPEELRLLARDSRKNAAPDLTPSFLASLLARCGAQQILLILDTCYSGAGVLIAQEVADKVQRERSNQYWCGVLASSRDFELACDGLFGERLLKLLRNGPTKSHLRYRWSTHNEGVCGDDIMSAMVEEWDWKSTKQSLKKGTNGNSLPMFPNPRFNPNAPANIVEHLLLAAAGRAPDEEGEYFTGRIEQINKIVAWARFREPGVLVVTGPAGSGKSAIVGRLVSLSNPIYRARLLDTAPLTHDDLGERTIHAQIHARQQTLDQVVEDLDHQLVQNKVLTPCPGGETRRREELINDLLCSTQCPRVVLDGLDEATKNALMIARDLVIPLAHKIQFIVATRELPAAVQGEPTLLQSLAAQHTIDLADANHSEQTKQDVINYVIKRLADGPSEMDTKAIAEEIIRLSNRQREGAFLLARIITSQLRDQPINTSESGWEKKLSVSTEDAFRRDIDRLNHPNHVIEILTALAWGYGNGIPMSVWIQISTALSSSERSYTKDDIYTTLTQGGRYIVEDGNGSEAVYRLSHQRLVEILGPPVKAAVFEEAREKAALVASALVNDYLEQLKVVQSPTHNRYLWQHIIQHCVDAGIAGIGELTRLKGENSAFVPSLATALINLSVRCRDARRHHDASTLLKRAVDLYRTQEKKDLALRPNLAMALLNLGVSYRNEGRHQDAIDSSEESVKLCRALLLEKNNAWLFFDLSLIPTLAMALKNLANCYSELDQHYDAINISEELFYLCAEQEQPILFMLFSYDGLLKMALDNLVNCYLDAGRHRYQITGLGISLTGLGISFGPIVKTENLLGLSNWTPRSHTTSCSLATALNNIVKSYLDASRAYNSCGGGPVVVDIDHPNDNHLITRSPEFLPNLAMVLNDLGVGYSAKDQHENAIAMIVEAVDLYCAQVKNKPELLPNLATTLNNLGSCYSKVEREHEIDDVWAQTLKILSPTDRNILQSKRVTNVQEHNQRRLGSLGPIGPFLLHRKIPLLD